MSERDVIDIREYAVVLEAFLRYEPIWELFLYLDSLDIKKQVFVEEAHAETVVKFGPLKLYFIEMCPAGISEINFGIKNLRGNKYLFISLL